MKIGILTFHRAHNYGAVLQCYALQEVLKGMGHEVEVIDYRQKWTEEVYKPLSLIVLRVRYKGIKLKIDYLRRFPKRYIGVRKKRKIFESFSAKYLSLSPKYEQNDELNYDVCIVGSDQLWGMSCLGGQFDDVYLGNFKVKHGGKKVAYAISSNLMSIESLNKQGRLLSSLNNFSNLSFRESIIIDRINAFTGLQFTQCLDPTLLTDKDTWKPLLNDKWKNRKYVVCYQVRGSGKTGFSVEQTTDLFAKKQNWDVVDLSNQQLNVEDFVSAIAYAQYVVTTSFHATVFSLIFNRQLAAYILHDGQDSRYEDLLRKIDCTQFIYEVTEKPILNQTVNWSIINDNLCKLRLSSLDYILRVL